MGDNKVHYQIFRFTNGIVYRYLYSQFVRMKFAHVIIEENNLSEKLSSASLSVIIL